MTWLLGCNAKHNRSAKTRERTGSGAQGRDTVPSPESCRKLLPACFCNVLRVPALLSGGLQPPPNSESKRLRRALDAL
eukprot:296142-Alexandrium_andersonii.AAC.1